jgi:hypothetical protein
MSDFEIREQIAAYLARTVGAAELEDWLHDVAWDLEDDKPTRSHVMAATRLLAEHARGDWTDDELRDRLGALNRSYWFELAPKQQSWGMSEAAVTEVRVLQSEAAGRLLVTASV